MDVQKAACRKSAVGRLVREGIRGTHADPVVSVLNTLKSMIGDEDILEKSDISLTTLEKRSIRMRWTKGPAGWFTEQRENLRVIDCLAIRSFSKRSQRLMIWRVPPRSARQPSCKGSDEFARGYIA